MGSGAFGPNLTDGDVDASSRRRPVSPSCSPGSASASTANQGYGVRGISSGRMPHFGAVLTKAQIDEIMAYERSL